MLLPRERDYRIQHNPVLCRRRPARTKMAGVSENVPCFLPPSSPVAFIDHKFFHQETMYRGPREYYKTVEQADHFWQSRLQFFKTRGYNLSTIEDPAEITNSHAARFTELVCFHLLSN